ncbi:hypothetical protein, partial [Alteromonas macleodii]
TSKSSTHHHNESDSAFALRAMPGARHKKSSSIELLLFFSQVTETYKRRPLLSLSQKRRSSYRDRFA